MSRVLLDLDDNLVAEAVVALGVTAAGEAVLVALQRAVDEVRGRRSRAMADLRAIADAGGFDFDRLPQLDA